MIRSRARWQGAAARGSVAGVGALAAAGCRGDLSALDPAGAPAQTISTMWSVMLLGAAAIFVLVMTLLWIGFRRAPTGPASVRTWLGGGGLAFVGAVLMALLLYGFLVGERLLPLIGPQATAVRAHAQQWRWEFSYPGSTRAATTDLLVIPAGRPVTVEITAADVIHSFWTPRLAGKIDAIPGQTNRLRLEAAQTGRYGGVCAEYCGVGHARHAFTVVAVEPERWTAFLAGAPVDAQDAR